MNVWYHLSTIFNVRRILQIAGLLTLTVAFITMLFFSISANAAPGVNQTVSFQGRLMTPQGQPVPEGYYNIQFKIYEGGTGTAAGNPSGTLAWTETRINDGGTSGVHVKNGYFSVDLGSVNPFGSQVDWNEDTLWLSMNIAGSSALCETFGTAPCAADGEMLPMKRLTSAPYALNSGAVGGKTASDLIHNGTTQQTASFNISGTGTANILQGSSSVFSPLVDRADAGTLSIGTTNASEITIGSASTEQSIGIGTSGTKTVGIGSLDGASATTVMGGTGGINIASATSINLINTTTGLYTFRTGDTGNVTMRLASGAYFRVYDHNESQLFNINNDGSVAMVGGATIGGTLSVDDDIFARGASIVYSENGSEFAGMSWLEGNTKPIVGTTTNSLGIQAAGLDILTAKNSTGKATIGIGNAADNGYALDVTGEINASSEYLINGVSTLSSNGLAFNGATDSSITAATGQGLRLDADGGVKIGDSTASGEPTLLTLDRASTTPAATGDAALGSMYYDTTLGKVQCYEADGWGACSSSPDNFVTLSPEYNNAVTNGSGIGDMTSDICSDTLNINDGSSAQPTICGTNETYNFYKWTTDELSAQTKDIYVTYQLPSNFTGFVDGSTSLVARTDDTAANVGYQVYRNTSTGLVACGSPITASTGAQTTWQKASASGSADPANCNFTAGDSLVFKISMTAEYTTAQTNAYVSTLSFAFSND